MVYWTNKYSGNEMPNASKFIPGYYKIALSMHGHGGAPANHKYCFEDKKSKTAILLFF